MPISAEDLTERVALMRTLGVVYLADGALEIELGPAPVAPTAAQNSTADEDLFPEEDACACGHPLETEHRDGLCLHACKPELCARKREAK